MMLTSLREYVGKEQHHGPNNARETARRKRDCLTASPCPEEAERNHAAGVLRHDRIRPSLCSLLTAYVGKAGRLGECDAGCYQALSLAQRAEACVRPCRCGKTHLDAAPERGAL